MNRITTALLAALEALLVVAIGIGIAMVPLTVLWAAHFGLSVEWFVFWRAAADIWLLGNGVDLTVQLGPDVAAALGLAGADTPFLISVVPLGFAMLSVLMGVHTGRRAAETPHRWTGVGVAVGTYAILAALVTLSAVSKTVAPNQLQGLLLPTLVYAAGVLVGAELGRRKAAGAVEGLDRVSRGIRSWYQRMPQTTRTVIEGALRGGTAAAAGVLIVSAVAVTALIALNYATIIGLYEAVQAGVFGGATITLAQLALIPNLVIWAAAWFVGPGIALGVGTTVSPIGTVVGTLPGLPLFGALPQGTPAYGFLGLLVPVLLGFILAVVTRQFLDRRGAPERTSLEHVLTGLGMGVVGGALLGLLAWWSAGAMGPGRLALVGPNPLLVGALAAAEIGVAAALGMLAGRVRLPSVRAAKR
ncbi:hypothetical protein SAMN05216368_102299 [Cryobacterium flavum]|uniref:Uncharacterized protein n=1 Tax=Cryobacterium flavum TaxID=1424659 RepID=A0A4R8VDM9_9MICO|nr:MULTISPECIES: DUF6350 family protein [Cryobacterium]TFB81003.1 hypothetical protein E3O21_03815 [Cryobacterium flavum]SDM81336.1 hypothetical protein SAMN05216368_102299 [Cryobacterium flavum]